MYERERWGVVSADHKYILNRGSGHQELYNLRVDPTEQHNLAQTTDELAIWWSRLESATGYPTGEGWRLKISHLKSPIQLVFETPIQAAEVTDPESLRTRRSNQEWGETPPLRSDDVATLRLESNGTRLHLTPGDHGSGYLALLGNPTSIEVLNAQGQPLGDAIGDRQTMTLENGLSLKARAGVVILAGETESLNPVISAEDAQRDALESLGYLQ